MSLSRSVFSFMKQRQGVFIHIPVPHLPLLSFVILIGALTVPVPALAQSDAYSDDWYTASASYVKIGVTADGVYRVDGAALEQAGLALGAVDPSTIRVLQNGEEIPLWIEGGTGSLLQSTDALVFIGTRNRGDDEIWAFGDAPQWQSSPFYSLFSDTTWYWLSWGGEAGLRYLDTDPQQSVGAPTTVSATRETVHLEEDIFYYFGDSNDAAQPQFTRGEGFMWRNITHTDTSPISQSFELPIDDIAAPDNPALDSVVVTVHISSASALQHIVSLQVAINGNLADCTTCFDEADWDNYAFRTLSVTIPRALFPEGAEASAVVTSNNEFNSIANRVLIDWVEVSYRSMLPAGVEQGSFTLPAGTYALERSNATAGEQIILNPNDRRRFVVPGAATALFNDAPTATTTYWTTPSTAYLAPIAVELHQTKDVGEQANPADYLIITTPALAASAEAMAAYRNAMDGYNVSIVYQADIFNQYDYGRPTPIAIRRFLQATQQWDTPPSFLMLWGDALRPEDNQARRPLRAWETISFGYAPADPWFGMQLNGESDWLQRLAIGRIPIRDNETGLFFLQKLGNYESSEPAAWQKRFMLLVGGRDNLEQMRLQERAILWSETAAMTPTAMDTLWFFKRATEALDPSFRDSLSAAFKNGASWISYFGHSAADTWEIVTDDPEDYDNADRLPIVLSMGCNTGNFAGGPTVLADRLVYGERLVLASLNGSIAHWGSSSASTISQPAELALQVHRTAFQDTTRILGQVFQEAKANYLDGLIQSRSVFTVLLQYGLIGDPATRIQIPDKPELQTSSDGLTILPVTPIPSNEKLDVTVTVRNWGLVPADSVEIQVVHQPPEQPQRIFEQRALPAALETEIPFTLPISETDVGDNRVTVRIDPGNVIVEVDETNNDAEKVHTVFSTGLAPIAPINFGIVASPRPLLRTSVASSDTTQRRVLFELDTTPTFDSPALQTISTLTNGVTADWQVPAPLEDGQGYYWRARIDDATQASSWSTSHFTVDLSADQPGWLQREAFFEENETDPFIAWNPETATWAFSDFRVDVRASSERGNGFEKGQFLVNATIYESTTLGFGVLIIDGATGDVRSHGSFPTYDMRSELEVRFDTDSTRAVARLDSMLNTLTTGDYLFVRTRHLGNLSGPEIQGDIKSWFGSLGSQAIDTLSYNHLWLMATRFGFPEETVERVEPPGDGFLNEIARDTSLFFSRPEGLVFSPPVGPARSWASLENEVMLSNADSEARIDIIHPETNAVLLSDVALNSAADLSTIDATSTPFLQLRASLSDVSRQSTPQLTSWRVNYNPVPELAIVPAETRLSSDTLSIGEPLTIQTGVANLSDQPAPVALVRYTLTDASNTEQFLGADTLQALAAGELRAVTFEVDTGGLTGSNRLRMELQQPDTPDPFGLNNVLIREFYVQGDQGSPSLEVLIDNEMLPSNPEPVRNLQDPSLPFVNARPTIEIVVTDDNPFQALNDTSLIQIQLNQRPVSFNAPGIQFQPGTLDNNEARVIYMPDLSGRDTTHTLFLRVFDLAGNEANGSPYQVHFRIQNDFEIESLYPYPNPMHNHTSFAFQLRGSDVTMIDDFRIRIYTIAGRLIREFDFLEDPELLDIPGLRIGWNMAGWDGRDADGDLVAPGVYLYKVFLRSDGRTIQVNNRSSIEKVVVLR